MEVCIQHHQVYLYLIHGLIKPEDIIGTMKLRPEQDDLIAFQHYLLFCRETNTPIRIDSLSGDYGLLYLAMRFSPCDITILDCAQLIEKFFADRSFNQFITAISGRYTCNQENDLMDEWAIIGRYYGSFSSVPPEIMLDRNGKKLLLNNAFSILRHIIQGPITHRFLSDLLDHSENMSIQQPLFWSYLSIEYTMLIESIRDQNFLPYYSDLHPKLIQLYPNLFPSGSKDFTSLAWKLYLLPPEEAGYFLGYPIQQEIPKRVDLFPALTRLSKEGVEEYCKVYREQNKQYMEIRLKSGSAFTLFDGSIRACRYVNEIDMLHEDVFMYSSRDLTILPDEDGRYFIITSPEIPTLIQNKKNHWTNKPLSEEFVNQLIRRHDSLSVGGETIPSLLQMIHEYNHPM